MGTLIVAAGY